MPESFEPLGGERPFELLDRDPSGCLAAYSTIGGAGIWDVETGRLMWDGDGATAIAFFPAGNEIAVLRSHYAPDPNKSAIFASPLQREFAWSFERLSWPERDTIATCPLTNWNTDFRSIAISPRADRAVVAWGHQAEAGMVLVSLAAESAQQIEGALWDTHHTNWLSVPVWAPDASVIVVFENESGAGNWWGGEEDDEASPGGVYVASTMVVVSRDLRELSRMPLRVDVPPGWVPRTDSDRGISCARFDGPNVVTVELPARGEQHVALPDLH